MFALPGISMFRVACVAALAWGCGGAIGPEQTPPGASHAPGPGPIGGLEGNGTPLPKDVVPRETAPAPAVAVEERVAISSALRRLTSREYDDTLADLLFDDRGGAEQFLDDVLNPFDNDYTEQTSGVAVLDGLELLAEGAIGRLLGDKVRRDKVVGCVPKNASDAACLRKLITTFGRRALRRPVTEGEIAAYLHGVTGLDGALDYAAEAGDFYVGVDHVLRAMLQEPEFLYRVEAGVAVSGKPGLFKLTDWEMASRLSYLVWGSTPDDDLLGAAEAGRLAKPADVGAAAATLLADPRARARIARFHALWIGFQTLPVGGTLGRAMQAESAALIGRVIFDEQRPWQDVFRLDETFVDEDLARNYGLPAVEGMQPRWIKHTDPRRRGLLSHGSFLSLRGKFDDTSPVQRAKLIRERLFCQEVVPPPPGLVDVDEPVKPKDPNAPNAFCKANLAQSHNEGGCAGCHAQLDPIGFGLESYDALGRFRTHEPDRQDTEADESQCAIDGKGQLFALGAFSGPAELQALALQSGLLGACVVEQLYRFAIGRSKLGAEDERFVTQIRQALGSGDFRFDKLLVQMVSDPAFGYRLQE